MEYECRQCDARLWEKGFGGQCARKKVDGECMCRIHLNHVAKEGKWWLGVMTEPRPEQPEHPSGRTHAWKISAEGEELSTKKEEEINTLKKQLDKLEKERLRNEMKQEVKEEAKEEAKEEIIKGIQENLKNDILGSIPDELKCPITQEIMKNPVVINDGHSYERDAIIRWFDQKKTSPLTNNVFSEPVIIENHALRKLCESFLLKIAVIKT